MHTNRLVSVGVLALIGALGMACGFVEDLMGKEEAAAPVAAAPVQAAPVAKRTPNPGFDCAKARSWSSKTVCTDADLADLDREMNLVYGKRRKGMNEYQKQFFRDWQKEWKRNQRDNCEYRPNREAQIECLKKAHNEQIEAIKKY